VALAAGALTFVSFGVAALDYHRDLAGWWTAAAFSLGAPLALLLAGLVLPCRRAARPWALPGDAAGDATTHLDELFAVTPILRSVPRPHTAGQLLCVVATVAAGAVALAGAVAGDPLDGLLRAGFEAVAVLACFAALGRRLALR